MFLLQSVGQESREIMPLVTVLIALFKGLQVSFDSLQGSFDNLKGSFDNLQGSFDNVSCIFDSLEGSIYSLHVRRRSGLHKLRLPGIYVGLVRICSLSETKKPHLTSRC